MAKDKRYVTISSDCHAGAPWFRYRDYLDPQYREDFDRWVMTQGEMYLNPSQQTLMGIVPSTFSIITPARKKEYREAMEKSAGHLGNWDPDIRVKELDREGIAGEVIFCDGSQKNHPPFGVGSPFTIKDDPSYEHRLAGARAHNRWLAELCQSNPGRHAGIALIVMDDIEAAVEEVRWARKNGLFGGILLSGPRMNADGPENFWHHPRYEPIWNVCEELDMPLNTHATNAGVTYGDEFGLANGIENKWMTFRPVWLLLAGGVFRRHPKLKLVCTEAGGTLVVWIKTLFDHMYEVAYTEKFAAACGPMKPSEYWDRQCYVGASAFSGRAEIDLRHLLGVKNIMWGSDYPHPEGTWPASMERTKTLFAGVPEGETRLMIGENAVRVYGFDMEKMRKIAERIGPKVEDLSGKPAGAAATKRRN